MMGKSTTEKREIDVEMSTTDLDALVQLINTTMMPQIFELKALMTELTSNFKHYIELQEIRSKEELVKRTSLEFRVTTLETVISGSKDSDDTGLKGKIGQLQEWMKARIWFERLIIAAVVVQIIGLLFLFVQNYLSH